MMGNLKEDDMQKLHTTAPEQLTDQELLLSTISAADLPRKHSDGWDKEHPKCLFCSKADFYSPSSHDLSGNRPVVNISVRQQFEAWRARKMIVR